MQGAWCGTWSRDLRITPWAGGRCSTTEPPGHPDTFSLSGTNLLWKASHLFSPFRASVRTVGSGLLNFYLSTCQGKLLVKLEYLIGALHPLTGNFSCLVPVESLVCPHCIVNTLDPLAEVPVFPQSVCSAWDVCLKQGCVCAASWLWEDFLQKKKHGVLRDAWWYLFQGSDFIFSLRFYLSIWQRAWHF